MTRARSILGVLILFGASAFGQTKRQMTIVDLINVPQMQEIQLSRDGSQVVFELAQADWEKNERVSHIFRVDIDGENQIQLTNGTNGEESPRWSPDGSAIVFVAKRGKDEHQQLYLLSNRGGEARPLTKHPSDVKSPAFSPDGSSIYFLAPEPKSEEEKEKDKVKDDVFSFDEDFKQVHLFRVPVTSAAAEEARRITGGDFSILSYRLSRDGFRIAHHRSPTPLFGSAGESEVWLMKADGSDARQLTQNTVSESSADLSPDGAWVSYVSNSNEKFEPYYNNNLFLVPAEGGAHRMILDSMPHEVLDSSWSQDGGSIFFTANTGARSDLFRVDVASESLTPLTKGDHSLVQWHYVPGAGKHVFGIDQSKNAGDVHVLPAAGGTPAKVSHVYDYLEDFQLPRQEAVQWKGADGVEVEGILHYPLDYKEGTRYALVAQTHGGPAASDKLDFSRWSEYIPILAAKGYFVFQPNYRGSTGYGDAVLRDMVGHYFNQAHLDVMTGVDHLIAKGLVDGDRMVKMGWSGGGHMTNKIITHTDRFKAASSGAGAVNWISMYAQSDVRIYRTPWFGGTPWQEDAPIDAYWNNSPLKDIYKAKTPTIVLVGEKDVRVPPPQSVELYRALKSNGVPSHLYIAPREPHGWQELRHELFKVNVELDWFEKHCMGREYVWEKAPATEKKDDKPTPTENQ